MPNDAVSPDDAAQQLTDQAAAIGALAANQGAFDAALDAFLEADAEGFRYVLGQENLIDRCELICEWFRIKWCVVTCLLLCGPPPEEAAGPADVGRIADAVARIAADQSLLDQVVEGVGRQDADDFRAVVDQLEIGDVCHYVCSWICAVLFERVCQIVCSPVEIEVATPAETVQAAAGTIARLAEDKASLERAGAAALTLDCKGLREVISDTALQDGCHIVCEWFCSYRCTWVCLELCRVAPVLEIADARAEVYAFAQAVGRLTSEAAPLANLVGAVQSANTEAFAGLTKELGLEPYCVQLCRWVCSVVCEEFCICVCPPVSTAIFTKIGGYYYKFDVASALGGTGLTNDNRAFFNTMRLNGGIALVDGAPQVEYRFETIATDAAGNPTGTWTPVLPTQIAATNIGTLVGPVPPFFIEVWVNGTPGPHVQVITPSADGWIQVPTMFPMAGWQFVPGSDLINLVSQTLQAWPADDESGVMAGSSANTPLANDVYYGMRMRLRNVGDLTDGSDAGTCTHVAIDDTLYDNVAHHTYWDGYVGTNELSVFSVGIAELISAGCAELSDSLTVEFTAAHPNLDTSASGVSVSLTGPGGPYAFTLSPAAPESTGDWYGTAVPDGWTLASLTPCAYIVTLSVNVLLTTGDDVPSPRVRPDRLLQDGLSARVGPGSRDGAPTTELR